MNKENISLLVKYLNNECTQHELIKVAELLTDPSNQHQVSELLEQASKKFHGHFETSPEHQERSWSKIRSELSQPGGVAQKKSRSYRTRWRIAASVIIVIGLGSLIGLYTNTVRNSNNEMAVNTKTVRSELGKRSKLTLPDGTIVIMNSGTKITYPEKFDPNARSVSLTGEAYFDVVEDSARPFTVVAQGVKTNVLGTTFNVRAYDYYDNVKVSLTSGKVVMQLPDNADELILKPGQEAIYDLGANKYKLGEFDREEVLGWQNGVLHFDNASEEQVISILEHWYNVNIEMVSSTSNDWENLTAKFDNEPLENVLISLGYTLGFNYEINGRNVKIIFK